MTILAVLYMAVKLIINIYHMRAIITLGLYFFYSLTVYNVERFILQNSVFHSIYYSYYLYIASYLLPHPLTYLVIRPHLHERGAIIRAVYNVRERRFIST